MQIITMSSQDVKELIQSVVFLTIENLKGELQQVPQNPASDQIFDTSELATYLSCTKTTIQNYKKRGVFKFYQTGRTVRFKKSEVDAALASDKKGLKHA